MYEVIVETFDEAGVEHLTVDSTFESIEEARTRYHELQDTHRNIPGTYVFIDSPDSPRAATGTEAIIARLDEADTSLKAARGMVPRDGPLYWMYSLIINHIEFAMVSTEQVNLRTEEE